MRLKTLGKNPTGELLQKILGSPHYKNGVFQNITSTTLWSNEPSFKKALQGYFSRPKTVTPKRALPSMKVDLAAFSDEKPTIVWFGHSSYLIRSQGVTLLVDPVFSGYASPVTFFGRAFSGTNIYSISDLPPIDVLIITHDHYDHLDFYTIEQLKDTVQHIVAPLGVSSHLEYWGVDKNKIIELDWWMSREITDAVKITATPTRHFSGRGLVRDKTLWMSYVVHLHDFTLFLGGDSGYDAQFAEIGKKFGPFDIAMLDQGQYNKMWADIHMVPEQAVRAAQDLRARSVLPVHWARFALGYHPWNEPIRRFEAAALKTHLPFYTPLIGQPFVVGEHLERNPWWDFE